MVELKNQMLTGSRFEHVDLSESRFHDLLLRDVRITGALIRDMVIDADIEGSLTVNEVDVVPFVEAELNRRYPERATIFAVLTSGADGFREAWQVVEEGWPATIERLRRLPPDKVHERVDGEWSAVETLRHLVFALDSWVKRAMLGDPSPYDPLDLPFTEMGKVDGVPNDPDARPSLDDVLALHADRMAIARAQIDGLTDEQLDTLTEPNTAPGYPAPEAYAVRRCLSCCVIEEWEHRRFIERDLAVLEAG